MQPKKKFNHNPVLTATQVVYRFQFHIISIVNDYSQLLEMVMSDYFVVSVIMVSFETNYDFNGPQQLVIESQFIEETRLVWFRGLQ